MGFPAMSGVYLHVGQHAFACALGLMAWLKSLEAMVAAFFPSSTPLWWCPIAVRDLLPACPPLGPGFPQWVRRDLWNGCAFCPAAENL